ncbi:ribonuclease E inhibitor RraB [Actinosynnema sp. NPDC023658]|uniref:ribonuclease E inhibitor RraB n=1 Tax=Actinosynnema sp. NPDC023658 TaxID=3155465 RepID=UPI0033C1C13C
MGTKRRADHLARERVRAEQSGRDRSMPVSVTHFFSSPGRHPEAIVQALNDLEITDVVVGEEVTGDGYWHVAAFATCPLTVSEAGGIERRMEQIAEDAGAEYNGWRVTLTAGEE